MIDIFTKADGDPILSDYSCDVLPIFPCKGIETNYPRLELIPVVEYVEWNGQLYPNQAFTPWEKSNLASMIGPTMFFFYYHN